MKLIKRLYIFILFVSLNNLAFGAFNIGGAYENQSTLLAGSEPTDFMNTSLFKLDFNYKDDGWRIYSDMRLGLSYGVGDLILMTPNNYLYTTDFNGGHEFGMSFSVPRLYLKAQSPIGTFTIGRNYLTFGQANMFNTLEWNKSFSLIDPLATKPAINMLSLDIPITAYGKAKIFVGGDDKWDTVLGGSEIIFGGQGYELGVTYQYKGHNTNVVGGFFKADVFVSIFGSYASHINNAVTDKNFTHSHEASLGIDYSSPISYYSLLVQQVFYYNSLGATDESDLIAMPVGDYYYRSYMYSYTSLSFAFDEFTSFGADLLISIADGSGAVLPKVFLSVANNLTLDISMAIFFGKEGSEFSYLNEGIPNISCLVKLIGSF